MHRYYSTPRLIYLVKLNNYEPLIGKNHPSFGSNNIISGVPPVGSLSVPSAGSFRRLHFSLLTADGVLLCFLTIFLFTQLRLLVLNASSIFILRWRL